MRKILLFGLLGTLGCFAGWMVGEGFLALALPSSKDTGGSLASKPTAPDLAKLSATARPPAALPPDVKLRQITAPPPQAPSLPVAKGTGPIAPPAPPILAKGAVGPAPAPPPEFAQRLDLAGAKSGDVQITLIWFNFNDLDLHCIDPTGQEVFYARRRVPSGGELDVDMNAGGRRSDRPVENIYWPKGKAPPGIYRVYVNHYANHGGKDPSEYKVSVLFGGERKEFSGAISRGQPKRLIYEFEMAPGKSDLQVAASPVLIVQPGSKNFLKVRLARSGLPAPVMLDLEGDLAGLTVRKKFLRADDTEADLEIGANVTALLGERMLTVRATSSGLSAVTTFKLFVSEAPPDLRLAVSPELILFQGGKNLLRIRAERVSLKGPILCRLEGDLDGLKSPEVTIGEESSEAELEISADVAARLGTRSLLVSGQLGVIRTTADFQLHLRTPPPELRLAVSEELIVPLGASNRLQVRLVRSAAPGPVQLQLSGNLEGVSPTEFVIPAGATEFPAELKVAASTATGNRSIKVTATSDGLRGEADFKLNIREDSPALVLAVPEEMQLNPGGRNDLPVRIARHRYSGPVTLRLDGETTGLSPIEFALAADRSEADWTLSAADIPEGPRKLRVIATGDAVGLRTDSALKLVLVQASGSPRWSWGLIFVIGFWTALLALGLSLALVMGQNWYLARPLISWSELALIGAGSLAAGVLAGGIGQTLYGLLTQAQLVPQIGFLLGWLLLGALLGRGVVFFIPNLSPWRATLAGSVGGFLGASAFLVVSLMGDLAGRLIGACILGFAIGLMVALVEAAFRKIWLEVVYPNGEVRSVNLGGTPVFLGGDGGKCTIQIAGAPARALKLWEEEGQIFCLDVVSEKTAPVSPGYRRRLKDAEVVVCSNERGSMGGTPRVSAPQKAPPPHPGASTPKAPPGAPSAPSVPPGRPHPAPAKLPPSPISSSPPGMRKPVPQASPPPAATVPVTPAQASSQKPLAPSTAACPLCGKVSKGVDGKRRCPDCFTIF